MDVHCPIVESDGEGKNVMVNAFRHLNFWLNIFFRSRLSIMLFPPVMTAIISQSFYLADFFTRAFVDLLFRNIKNYMNFMQKNFTLSPEPRQVALHRT